MNNVSILITNKNGEQILPTCLKQIRKCYPNIKVRVINDCTKTTTEKIIEWNQNDKSPEICKEYNVECININEPNPYSHMVDYFVQKGLNHVNEDIVITMDNDTLMLRPGIIEFAIKHFNNNPKLIAIGELLSGFNLSNKTVMIEDGTLKHRPPRLSTWFTILNVKRMKEHNICYGAVNQEQYDLNEFLELKYKQKFNLAEGDDGAFIYLQIFDKGLDVLDLNKEFEYNKNAPIELKVHEKDFIRRFCDYYFHIAHFSFRDKKYQEYNLQIIKNFLNNI